LALLIRTLTANSTLDWPSQDNQPENKGEDVPVVEG